MCIPQASAEHNPKMPCAYSYHATNPSSVHAEPDHASNATRAIRKLALDPCNKHMPLGTTEQASNIASAHLKF